MPDSQPPRRIRDESTHRTLPLDEGTYVIGRSRSADVFIDDHSASRKHALITVRVDATRIEDLASKNGTLVNGESLRGSRQLNVGDRITIGAHHFTLRPALESQSENDGRLLREEAEWSPVSDQTERTLDLLDVLLNERARGYEQAMSLANLIVTSVDEVLDTVGATRPALTRRQAYRLSRLIGVVGVQAHSAAMYAWQANARRRLDTLRQQSNYSAA